MFHTGLLARWIPRAAQWFISQRAARTRGKQFDLAAKQLVETKDGFRLFVFPDDYIGAAIATSRQFEPHVAEALRRILRPGHTFLDVGGNLGYFTCLGAQIVGPTGRVETFEPIPTNVTLIRASVGENRFSNVTLHQVAASDRAGKVRFQTIGTNGGVVNDSSQDFDLEVQCVALDDYLPSDIHVDVVKMDIEAHEVFALSGMRKLIQRCRPAIAVEWHPWAMQNHGHEPERLLRDLLAYDYALSVVDPGVKPRQTRDALDVVRHWRSLRNPTAHVDLLAMPQDASDRPASSPLDRRGSA
jgi:FkbM family methyltransferase